MKSTDAKKAIIACAQFSANVATISHEKTIDQHNSAFRWLLASLFALNGGAIFAVLNSEIVSKQAVVWAAPIFFVGVLATFWMAIMGQNSDRKMIAGLSRWGLYWTTVSVTGQMDPSQETEIKEQIDKAEILGRRGRQSGIFAMLCFIAGCIVIGWRGLN